jgi:ferredoxin
MRRLAMAYVITENCIGVKDRACAQICPLDCIEEGQIEVDGVTYDQMFIDPDECIDCGLCEPACPVDAIFQDVDVPAKWSKFVTLNAEYPFKRNA